MLVGRNLRQARATLPAINGSRDFIDHVTILIRHISFPIGAPL